MAGNIGGSGRDLTATKDNNRAGSKPDTNGSQDSQGPRVFRYAAINNESGRKTAEKDALNFHRHNESSLPRIKSMERRGTLGESNDYGVTTDLS